MTAEFKALFSSCGVVSRLSKSKKIINTTPHIKLHAICGTMCYLWNYEWFVELRVICGTTCDLWNYVWFVERTVICGCVDSISILYVCSESFWDAVICGEQRSESGSYKAVLFYTWTPRYKQSADVPFDYNLANFSRNIGILIDSLSGANCSLDFVPFCKIKLTRLNTVCGENPTTSVLCLQQATIRQLFVPFS